MISGANCFFRVHATSASSQDRITTRTRQMHAIAIHARPATSQYRIAVHGTVLVCNKVVLACLSPSDIVVVGIILEADIEGEAVVWDMLRLVELLIASIGLWSLCWIDGI